MKYNKITNAFKIAAVAAIALAMAPAAKAQATGCNNAMLRGTFVYTLAGFSANPAEGPAAEPKPREPRRTMARGDPPP